MKKYFIILIIAILITWAVYPAYLLIGCKNYDAILQALLNISSIIFAIIGAWIAIIYPKSIIQTFSKEDVKNNTYHNDTNYLAELVEIVLVSAFVLMIVLTIQFSIPIAQHYTQQLQYKIAFKTIFFFVIALMTTTQLYAILRVIIANYFFLNELRKKNIKDAIDRLHG